jgi:hypothetical protein
VSVRHLLETSDLDQADDAGAHGAGDGEVQR